VIMLASGFCLALHFGAWVWGIGHTSLPHSLLLISATPVLIAIGMLLLCKPISKGELAGTVLGALGVCLLVTGHKLADSIDSFHRVCHPLRRV
jgi:drug/metabolite transporter (DMT)-like permease